MEDYLQGQGREVASGSIGTAGGVITVEDADTSLCGTAITFPEGALDKTAEIAIREAPHVQLRLPTGFEKAIGSCFEVNSGGIQPVAPVTVTVPFMPDTVSVGEELVLVSEGENGWDMYWPERVNRSRGEAAFAVNHFSAFQLSSGHRSSLANLPSCAVSGFSPSKDGFPACNTDDNFPEGGACKGICSFVKWYFENRAGTDGPLMARFGTHECAQIGSIAQKFYNTYARPGESIDEVSDVLRIIVSLRNENRLQYVGLADSGQGTALDRLQLILHVVLAYRWDQDKMRLYCFDPNTAVGLEDEASYIQVDGDKIYYVNRNTFSNWYLIKREVIVSLGSWGSAMRNLYQEWASGRTTIRPNGIYAVDGGVIDPGDLLNLGFLVVQEDTPIECRVYAEIAREDDLSSVMHSLSTKNLGTLNAAPGEPHSEEASIGFVLPADAPPGKYVYRAAVIDAQVSTPTDWPYQVVYDTTEIGVGNGWSEAAWIHAFDIGECANDDEPPSVTLNCGTPDSSGNVSFSWSGSDNCSSSISYQYILINKDTSWSSWSSTIGKSYYSLSDGTYTFCVKAKDESGNISVGKCCRITISSDPCENDSAPPSVTLNCGTPDSSGNVSFSWSGTDNCSSSMSYQYILINKDTSWSSWSSTIGKSYYSLSDGTYTFCVKAKDESGNISVGKCCRITISSDPCENDSTSPSVTLNCGTPDSSGNVSFSWSGSDNCSSSISYQYKLEGKDTNWSSWSHSTSKSYYSLSSGTYQFCVKANDETGNISSSKCCTIIVSQNPCANDSTPPSVTLNCGTPNASGEVTISWSGSDNCTMTPQLLYQYLMGGSTYWSEWTPATSRSYSGFPPGRYIFRVKAKDLAENVSAEKSCTIEFPSDPCSSDTQAPSLSLNCGTPSSSGSVSFSWNGTDNCATSLQYQYKLEGHDTSWSSWTSSTTKSYSALSAGSYRFCVKAKDEKGNVSSERCCSFTTNQDCSNSPEVWTDKSSYCIGDPITIYMRFTAPSTASLLDDKENGYTKYLFQNKSYASGTYTISGEVDGPAGLEHLTLSSTACASTRTDSVTISI
ncbi:MAG: triple tyrosine motif-containing protein, partial [Candidatus Thorarchaeota archaeon]